MAEKRQYRFGPYEFGPVSGMLTHGKDTIPLRPKIADLLTSLVRSAPEVVLKDDLISRVWPDTNIVESGLARNVNELRKSLSEEPEAIETIPKRGYRFTIPVESTGAPSGVDPAPPAPVSPLRSPSWLRRGAILALGVVGAAASAPLLRRLAKSNASPSTVPLAARSAAEVETEVKKEGAAGYHNWGKWEEPAMHQALIHFRRAASLDARLWYGYVGLADSYLGLVMLANRIDPEWGQWARHAAERAVQLGPNIAITHCALGSVRLVLDWDSKAAAAAFENALRANVFNYVAYQRRGVLRTIQGRFEEARVDLRKATELKPEFFDGQISGPGRSFAPKILIVRSKFSRRCLRPEASEGRHYGYLLRLTA